MSLNDPLDDEPDDAQIAMLTRASILIFLDVWRVIMRRDDANEHIPEFISGMHGLMEALVRLNETPEEEGPHEPEPTRNGTTH